MRRDLQLEDADGIDCLPNATIFEQLALMGPKTTAWNEFSSTMASTIICLATNQKFNFSKYIFESMVKNLDNVGKVLMYTRFVQVFLDNQLEGISNLNTSSTDSQMHNNIMAAGSKDRPPMLGPGRYSQWRSRFLRYIDTKINGEGLKKCILNGPYVPTSVLIQAVPAAEGRPAVQQHTTIETVLNMTPENKEHFLSEKEAIFLLLTGIGDEIYSTVDAMQHTNEILIAIDRLQQESMESYYSRFYKLMNELTRNNLQVTTMQVNVQFLQQLQPEWSRFVTVVKQSKEIDTISYHTLFDILKQYQNEVNDIRAERIAKSANPLALLAAAQPYSDNYYQAPKPQRSNATSSSIRPNASTIKAKRSPNQYTVNRL
ncbi:hypothetical protein Tco_0324213 [Tanacetum coccineum]